MKVSDLKNKSINELKSKLWINKIVSFSFVVVLSLLCVFSIYGLVVKEDTSTFIALFAVACSCWSFLPIPFNSLKKVKTELKLRNSSN